jgi:hypothetical protein
MERRTRTVSRGTRSLELEVVCPRGSNHHQAGSIVRGAASPKPFMWAPSNSSASLDYPHAEDAGSPTLPLQRAGWDHTIPRPPPSAVPSQRPVARQRPMAQSLDLFDARGSPALASRASRSRVGTGRLMTSHVGNLLAGDDEFAAPVAQRPANIPIIIDDSWGAATLQLFPAIERTVALGSGRRCRKP